MSTLHIYKLNQKKYSFLQKSLKNVKKKNMVARGIISPPPPLPGNKINIYLNIYIWTPNRIEKMGYSYWQNPRFSLQLKTEFWLELYICPCPKHVSLQKHVTTWNMITFETEKLFMKRNIKAINDFKNRFDEKSL